MESIQLLQLTVVWLDRSNMLAQIAAYRIERREQELELG
jgi:hypothetical protein